MPARKPGEAWSGALRNCGYLPHADDDGRINLRNCPFHLVAADHRDVVCGLNLRLVEGVIAGLWSPARARRTRSRTLTGAAWWCTTRSRPHARVADADPIQPSPRTAKPPALDGQHHDRVVDPVAGHRPRHDDRAHRAAREVGASAMTTSRAALHRAAAKPVAGQPHPCIPARRHIGRLRGRRDTRGDSQSDDFGEGHRGLRSL